MDATACANCARTIDGEAQKFCPACGQPTPARRIDWGFMRDQFQHDVLNMDRGLLHTLKRLIVRPGKLLRSYIDGQREGIVKPLPLLMIMSAVILLLTSYVTGAPPLDPPASNASPGAISVNKWVNEHLALFTVLLIPMEALFFKIAFRRFKTVNYPEWLAILAYLTSQGFVIWSVVQLFQGWLPLLVVQLIGGFGTMSYAIVSLMQFFREAPWWNILLRGFLAHLMFIVGQSVILRTAESLVGALIA